MKGHIEITKILEIDIPQDVQDPNIYADNYTKEYLSAHDLEVEEVDITAYVYDE